MYRRNDTLHMLRREKYLTSCFVVTSGTCYRKLQIVTGKVSNFLHFIEERRSTPIRNGNDTSSRFVKVPSGGFCVLRTLLLLKKEFLLRILLLAITIMWCPQGTFKKRPQGTFKNPLRALLEIDFWFSAAV